MARFEMNAGELALMAPGAANEGEIYFELGCLYAAGRDVELNSSPPISGSTWRPSRGVAAAAQRRQEVAAEMSAGRDCLAQRDARLWLSRQ